MACCATSITDTEGILNHDLLMLSAWAKQWLVSFNPSKTVAMLFTNKAVPFPRLVFDNVELEFVNSHKHLGLTLSSNAKWKDHILNITKSASKVLGMMRALKFRLNRVSLNQMYTSFLRPLLEYASVVWDNCTQTEQDLLDKIQNEAARITTGVTRSISLFNLYKEIGWLKLSDRRKYQKLILTFKIIHDLTPNYLSEIFPPHVGNRTEYPLRNASNIEVIARRTELFASSFVPSSVSLWNELPENIKSITSLSAFKSNVKKMFPSTTVPKYYSIGKRQFSIIHTRLRNKCSDLQFDLYNNHLSNNGMCVCGYGLEDCEHFFFRCHIFYQQRILLFRQLRIHHPLNLNILLYGSNHLSVVENSNIFLAVQSYIRDSGRFE